MAGSSMPSCLPVFTKILSHIPMPHTTLHILSFFYALRAISSQALRDVFPSGSYHKHMPRPSTCRLPLVLVLALALLSGIDAFRVPTSFSSPSSSSSPSSCSITRQSSSSAVLAPISHAALGGRRRGKALAVFSGIIEQMGTVKGVQADKDMVLWSGDTGKGEAGGIVCLGWWLGWGGRGGGDGRGMPAFY